MNSDQVFNSGYGPLDPSNPRDRAWATAWSVYEKLKQAWAQTGYAPKRAPLFNWDTRAGPDQGATLRTTTGRLKRIRIQWNKVPGDRLLHIPARPRQPGHQRHTRAPTAHGDRADPDPDPESKSPSKVTTPPTALLDFADDRDDDTHTVSDSHQVRKSVTLPVVRDGVACPGR